MDVPGEYLKYLPQEVVQGAEIFSQRSVDVGMDDSCYVNSEGKYLPQAEALLKKYRDNAELVVTGALHCASPCIAMGIPTILIDFKGQNERFGSLSGIFKTYSKQDLLEGNIDWGARNAHVADIEGLKKLMLKNVKLSVLQALGKKVDAEELNATRQKIEAGG